MTAVTRRKDARAPAARFALAMWFTLSPDKGRDLDVEVNVVPAAVSSAPATAGGGVLRATELTDLERMLEEKIAKAKDSLGFDDDELAKLLSKLEFVEAPPR